jgi:isopenicillin N synthase-like dioxygenase
MPDMPVQTSPIPILDLGAAFAGEADALDRTAAELRHACERVGFMYITNHGVPQSLIDATFAMAARFHAQPLEAKMALKLDDAMQGYLPYRSSTARANGLVAVRKPNENEAFFVLPERDPARPANRWPEAMPEFQEVTTRYYAALETLALRMLPLYDRALGMPDGFFAARCTRPHASLRLTHYPAMDYGQDEYGIAPHTDSSFMTLLAQNPVPGLQIRTQAGEWIDAPVIPGTFVVNTGDVLNRWTNGRFLSTPHRAFNVTKAPRYAIPFFFHPDIDASLACLPTCTDAANPPRFPAQTVGEYMSWFRNSNYDHFRNQAGTGQQAPATA